MQVNRHPGIRMETDILNTDIANRRCLAVGDTNIVETNFLDALRQQQLKITVIANTVSGFAFPVMDAGNTEVRIDEAQHRREYVGGQFQGVNRVPGGFRISDGSNTLQKPNLAPGSYAGHFLFGHGRKATIHLSRHHRRGNGQRKDRKSTRLNSSHVRISYAVFCLKNKTKYYLLRASAEILMPFSRL